MAEEKCIYDEPYRGRCERPTIDGSSFCEEHAAEKCCVCGEQATHGCPHAGQFVCCYPLCNNCEGFEERSQPSGAWGFMNHRHRRKE